MWLLYGILAQASVSVAVYIDKYILEKHVNNFALVAIVTGILSFGIGFTLFIFRGFPTFSPVESAFLLAAGVLLYSYIVPYMKALSLDDPSRVVPLFQFTPVFTILIGTFLLKEQFSLTMLLGFSLVLVSGFVLSVDKDPERIFKLRPAFWYMMLSALFLCLSLIAFDQVVSNHNFWDCFSYASMGIGLGTLLSIAYPPYTKTIIRDMRALPKNVWVALGFAELFNYGYQLGYAYAVSLAGATLVSLLEATQPAIVLIYGVVLTLFFPNIVEEDISKNMLGRKIAAIVCIAIGFFFLYL